MNLYETVKGRVTPQMAAERYDLPVNRSGMACCPFHNDRTPSMKLNDDYFYCFGCGIHGDVIDLVARLFNLSSYDAAKKLAYDFGIDPDKPPAAAALRKPKYPLAKAFQNETLHCQRILYDYLHLLEHWKMQYAPKTPDDLRAPAETQQSGFGGKRRRKGANERFAAGGAEVKRTLRRRADAYRSLPDCPQAGRVTAFCLADAWTPFDPVKQNSPRPDYRTGAVLHVYIRL